MLQPWIHSVKRLSDENLSKWTLRKKVMGVPLEFSWVSRAHEPIEHQLISWEAISGLENRGRVEFREVSEESAVDVSMSVDYKLPRILSMIFRSVSPVGNLYRHSDVRFSSAGRAHQKKRVERKVGLSRVSSNESFRLQ